MSGDSTNPKNARWYYTDERAKPVDMLSVQVDDETNTVTMTFGQSVGDFIVEVAVMIVQRDVAEAFGGSLLALGNKPRPGE